MDPIADIIAGLSLLMSTFVFWQQRREQRHRIEWEQRQAEAQRRQWLEENQPELQPVGTMLRYDSDRPNRLATDAGDQGIQVQNVGKGMPRDVCLVLFPSESRLVLATTPPSVVRGPADPYWQGSPAISIAPGDRCDVVLTARRAPLQGDHRVGNQALFPPAAPGFGAAATGNAPLYAGRLTVACRDLTGRKLAGTFDLDAETGNWHRTAFQPDIDCDLLDLIEASNGQLPS